jgi:uncharacterized membrane protein (DUF2068 family)
MANQRSDTILRLIALFKLAKALALITIGIVALRTAGIERHDLERWAAMLRVDPSNTHIHRLIARLGGMSTRHLEELGAGTFIYAAVFLVEGTGLMLRKRWGELFSVIVTTSFIPFEIYELVHHVSIVKVVAIAINVAVVVYLIVRLRGEIRHSR